MRSLGWDAGAIEPGRLADFVALRLDSTRLAGAPRQDLLAAAVFAATAADVAELVVGASPVVTGGRHLLVEDVPGALARSIAPLVAPR
jgi:cytosine/adenosine deaminase-related metal-dependent hydrolase